MNHKPEILIIDDEPQIRKLLEISLESNGYIVRQAINAREGIAMAANHPPDLILLDLELPDLNGHEVLMQLKSWYKHPVIILSVRNHETDIVKALDNGATDYLSKPFRAAELMARIRSSLRRTDSDADETILHCGDLDVDLVGRSVRKHGVALKLTVTEYKLLVLLMRHEGKVLTHPFILKTIWGTGYQSETQYLRVFIAQLRKKIEDNPNHPSHIITESGVGYRFV